MKNPQAKTHQICINNAQLKHIIDAMILQQQLPENEIDTEFDVNDVFYVSPADTLSMLADIMEGDDGSDTLHGLCV